MTNNTAKNTNIQLSVVIVVHDEETALEQNLPHFLHQECDTPYEVIVVDDFSTDRTSDVLKQFKEECPALHTTFLPKSVPNPSRQQLAMYIGAKAAKSDWVVFADIHRPPRKNPEIVEFASYQHLEDAIPILQKTERHSGKGHHGIFLKRRRGIYDAVAIHRDCIYEAIRQYDQHVKSGKLLALRMLVFWKN